MSQLMVVKTTTTVTTYCPNLTERQRWDLTPQARLVFDHMRRAGSISARDAMADHGITSATLARRICDLEAVGVLIQRQPREHPLTERRYTRYLIQGNSK